jgi:hypothetical protein
MNRSARTGQLDQDKDVWTGRRGPSDQDSQRRAARPGMPKHEGQNRTGRTRHQHKTVKTGHLEDDNQPGQSEQDT